MEKYGTGFIRIREHLKDYPELHYIIQDLHDFLRIIIKLNTDVTKDVTKEKRLEEVLNLVSKNKFISTKDMAKLLDVTMRTIMRDIETLRDKGNSSHPPTPSYYRTIVLSFPRSQHPALEVRIEEKTVLLT